MHQCRIAADEVYAAGIRSSLESLCELDWVTVGAGCCQHSYGSYGDTLVYDGDSVLLLYLLTNRHKIACLGHYLVVDLLTGLVYIRVDTVKERYTHSDSTYIKALVLYHADSFKNIIYVKHLADFLSSDTVHGVENILVHCVDREPQLCTKGSHPVNKLREIALYS